MSDQTPFQEKPDWKGKLTQLSEMMTGFTGKLGTLFRRQKPDGGSPVASSPLPPPPTENTLTGRISQAWKNRFSPRVSSAFSKMKAPRLPPGSTIAAAPPAVDERSLNFLALVISVLLLAYVGADLTALLIDQFIPEPPPVRTAGAPEYARQLRTLQDYDVIVTRNLFNSRGLIPGDDLPATPADSNNVPVKTNLPFTLIGTLVMKNELRSIATIEDTSEQRVYPVRVDDEIPGRARIIAIEPFRVIFVNPTNGRREYVEIPQDAGAAPQITLSSGNRGGGGAGAPVEQVSATQFNVSKSEIDASLAKWEEILTQARAVPHTENGQPAGFMLLQIVPGSIYDKLGLKNRDVLRGVNGEPVNDLAKAMKLLELLQTSNSIELQVSRGGKITNFTYNIR